ncbi:MAG: hypothetical protein HQK54_12340, partial [Oligoflexales bacterium]|nr:hypothetical protein [Oligoflexales bacterium]
KGEVDSLAPRSPEEPARKILALILDVKRTAGARPVFIDQDGNEMAF